MKTLDEIISNSNYKSLNVALKERTIELASKLLECLIPLRSHFDNSFKLGGIWFEIRHFKASAGSEDFLFMSRGEDEGALDVSKSYYYCNDFNCWVQAASSNMRLYFLNNAKQIFADLDNKIASLNSEIERALNDTADLLN